MMPRSCPVFHSRSTAPLVVWVPAGTLAMARIHTKHTDKTGQKTHMKGMSAQEHGSPVTPIKGQKDCVSFVHLTVHHCVCWPFMHRS